MTKKKSFTKKDKALPVLLSENIIEASNDLQNQINLLFGSLQIERAQFFATAVEVGVLIPASNGGLEWNLRWALQNKIKPWIDQYISLMERSKDSQRLGLQLVGYDKMLRPLYPQKSAIDVDTRPLDSLVGQMNNEAKQLGVKTTEMQKTLDEIRQELVNKVLKENESQ